MFKRLGLLLILTTTLILPLTVQADVVDIGQKSVVYCVQIENIRNYPDYVFVLYPVVLQGIMVIEPGECTGFYKFGEPSIFAVKKSLFDEDQIALDQEKNVTPKNLIPSGIKVQRYTKPVLRNDPLEEVHDVFEIKSISDTELKLVPSKVVYIYEDGGREERPFEFTYAHPTGEKVNYHHPEPARSGDSPWWMERFWHIVVPVAAVVVMGVVILIQHRKKK